MYLRNLCIFELMTYSGLRISEVSNLLMTDVYFAERQIRVIGKGQRTRLVPITDTVAKRIRAYLKERSASAVNIRPTICLLVVAVKCCAVQYPFVLA